MLLYVYIFTQPVGLCICVWPGGGRRGREGARGCSTFFSWEEQVPIILQIRPLPAVQNGKRRQKLWNNNAPEHFKLKRWFCDRSFQYIQNPIYLQKCDSRQNYYPNGINGKTTITKKKLIFVFMINIYRSNTYLSCPLSCFLFQKVLINLIS